MTKPNALSPNTQPNALMPQPSPEQRLEREIKRLGQQFGNDVVRAAVKKVLRKKVGRKRENDWSVIGPEICDADAQAWLDGVMPRERLSNSQIAKDFAKRFPGHEPNSTYQRIMKKLSKERILFCLYTAIRIAEKERPIAVYLKALQAVQIANPDFADGAWGTIAFFAMKEIDEYELRFGVVPDDLTMVALKAKLEEARQSNALLGSGTNALAQAYGMFAPRRLGGSEIER